MEFMYCDEEPNYNLHYFLIFFSAFICYEGINIIFKKIKNTNNKVISYVSKNKKINIKTYEYKELFDYNNESTYYILMNYLEDYGSFNLRKIRDGFLRMFIDIKKSNEYFYGELHHCILQKMYKPRDYFEIYMYYILNEYSFDIIITTSLKPRFCLENFEILKVLRGGPHILFDKKGNKRDFDWEMDFNGQKINVKNMFFEMDIYKRDIPIENEIININYDVKIIYNPFEIPEKYLKYAAQLI